MDSEIILFAGGIASTLSVIGCAVVAIKVFSEAEETIDRYLLKFLEEADNAYIDMYIDKNVNYFIDYADTKLCYRLEDEILSPENKLFSASGCIVRKWQLLSEIDGVIKVRKDVVHELVTVSKGLKLPMGDNIVEIWDIIKYGRKYKVANIRGVG